MQNGENISLVKVMIDLKSLPCHLLTTPLPTLSIKCWCWWCTLLLVGELSHGEGDEAVVSLDVPLQDLWARPKHTLKARPVQLHAFEGATCDNGGSPGTIQQQGDLTWMETRRGPKIINVSECKTNLSKIVQDKFDKKIVFFYAAPCWKKSL